MPTYEVTFHESQDLTYVVEASDPIEAETLAGERWSRNDEPDDKDSNVDGVSVVEADEISAYQR